MATDYQRARADFTEALSRAIDNETAPVRNWAALVVDMAHLVPITSHCR